MKSTGAFASLVAVTAISGSIFLFSSHVARSSDHQDSPTVVARPGADITDVYLFPSPTNPKAVDLVMDVVPLIPAGMASDYFFDPSVLYQFKIAHGPVGSAHQEDDVIQMTASGTGPSQTLSLYGTAEPAMVGPRNTLAEPIGTFAFDKPGGTELAGGIKAFAGPRADPFFFDLFQFFMILPDRDYKNARTGDALGSSTPTFNGYAPGSTAGAKGTGYFCNTAPATNTLTEINGGFNVLSIVLEIPRAALPRYNSSIVHVWATTSIPTSQKIGGKVVYQQIEQLSRPAVKELFETFDEHALTNAQSPYFDGYLHKSIAYFMSHVAGRSPAISNTVASVLWPNEIVADVSQPGPAAYLGVETGGATGSKFGGRGLTDDVITTSLGVVFGNTIPALGLTPDDGKENYCLTNEHVASGQGGRQTQSTYPYLASPH
jgi:hypothetical protein